MTAARVAVSITEGRTVRDLFYSGFLDKLVVAGVEVTIFTEATAVPAFVAEWSRPGVTFERFVPRDYDPWQSRAVAVRRRLARLGRHSLLEAWLAFERRNLFAPRRDYREWFRRHRPAALLTTHAHTPWEGDLVEAARAEGVPTLGFVRSWDNVQKGIRSRPDRLAVWNEVNRREVIELEGYRPEDVEVVGAPQFDPYFDPRTAWPREKLATELDLDPNRPIVLFATLGSFIPGLDETCWMEELLALVGAGAVPGEPQVICRLHPWSRLEQFQRYADHPDVRLSYVDKYWPALTWYMTANDVSLMANMLQHADVVVTPGSTVVLEAAIFDRPTLVPVFHTYQPERARAYFDWAVFGAHYRRIANLDLVPIVRRREDFAPALARCLSHPEWYAGARRRLARDYVTFTDGRSTDRLVDLFLRTARLR